MLQNWLSAISTFCATIAAITAVLALRTSNKQLKANADQYQANYEQDRSDRRRRQADRHIVIDDVPDIEDGGHRHGEQRELADARSCLGGHGQNYLSDGIVDGERWSGRVRYLLGKDAPSTVTRMIAARPPVPGTSRKASPSSTTPTPPAGTTTERVPSAAPTISRSLRSS